MLKDKMISVKTTNKNISHYKEIYPDIKSGDVIEINPEQLPYSSKHIVTVICDINGEEREISIFSYRRNIEKFGYYSCPKCSNIKSKETSIEKYGVDSFTKTKEYLEKTRETKLERYGDEKYVNIDKIKETCLEKYGEEYYISTHDFKIKSLETMNNKYGVDRPLQNKEILEKLITTNNKRYGVDFVLQNEEIREKSNKTKLERYGDENYNNREQYKETCLEKFGFDNPNKNEIIKNKIINTMYERYGVYYPAQLEKFYNKMIKNGYLIKQYKDTGLYYQGNYEKDFLEKYYDIGIKRGPTIRYIYNDKEHFYYSDFYYEKLNLIIEIKSTKWYEEHLEKNLSKQEQCRKDGYNFIFIIDKNYEIFDKIIKHDTYDKEHCWQYELRLNTYNDDLIYLSKNNIDIDDINIKDFTYNYIDSNDKEMCEKIKLFIEKYEWLGKMPNRPTHRFISMYNGIIAGVIVMATPNNFSNFLGYSTKDIEKLVSRGACASWTPKNLASSLLMWSIKWMSKNTEFRLFSAYSDTEAKEIGTIYQACNFYYIGQNFGSDNLYFDLKNPKIGWTSGRNFRKKSFYKKIAKEMNIIWKDEWLDKYTIKWDIMPENIKNLLINESKERLNNCLVRKTIKKHKYVYILGNDNKETKKIRKLFLQNNKIYDYPKRKPII